MLAINGARPSAPEARRATASVPFWGGVRVMYLFCSRFAICSFAMVTAYIPLAYAGCVVYSLRNRESHAMSFGESFRWLFKEGATQIFWQAITSLILVGLPLLVATMTGILGYLQGYPLAYVIAAATVAFAMMATGLLRFDELIARRSAAHKVHFAGAAFALDYSRDEKGRIEGLPYAQAIFVLINSASFPLSYELDDANCSFDNKVNAETKLIRKGILPATSQLQYRIERIDLENMAPRQTVAGKIKFRVRYGKVGRERYPIEKNLNITCNLNKQTNTYDQIYLDAPEEPLR
jgi:hypothetical protein